MEIQVADTQRIVNRRGFAFVRFDSQTNGFTQYWRNNKACMMRSTEFDRLVNDRIFELLNPESYPRGGYPGWLRAALNRWERTMERVGLFVQNYSL